MKKAIFIFLILFSIISYSQTTARISYYHNNKNIKLNNLEVYIAVENDTTKIETGKNKIIFPRIDTNFDLFIKVNGEKFEFGAIAPEVLNENLEIVVGKIDSMRNLKKSTIEPTAYYLRNKYLIQIENRDGFKELNFVTLIQNKKIGENRFVERQSGSTKIIK